MARMRICHGAAEGKEKTVSIETEAILSGNYWLLIKKAHVCSGVGLFLALVRKLLPFMGCFAVIFCIFLVCSHIKGFVITFLSK